MSRQVGLVEPRPTQVPMERLNPAAAASRSTGRARAHARDEVVQGVDERRRPERAAKPAGERDCDSQRQQQGGIRRSLRKVERQPQDGADDCRADRSPSRRQCAPQPMAEEQLFAEWYQGRDHKAGHEDHSRWTAAEDAKQLRMCDERAVPDRGNICHDRRAGRRHDADGNQATAGKSASGGLRIEFAGNPVQSAPQQGAGRRKGTDQRAEQDLLHRGEPRIDAHHRDDDHEEEDED